MGEITYDEESPVTATPGQLKETVAELFKLPTKAVDYPWRAMREAGLVSKGGRGPSAAKVTATDTALLLIAVAGPLPAADVVTAVRRYAGLPIQTWPGEAVESPFAPPAIADAPTFVDGLAGLIASAADGSLATYRDHISRKPDLDPRVPGFFELEVTLYGAFPQAGFRAYGGNGEFKRHFTDMPTDIDELRVWKTTQPGDDSDLSTLNRFGGRTIWRLGELIGEAK